MSEDESTIRRGVKRRDDRSYPDSGVREAMYGIMTVRNTSSI